MTMKNNGMIPRCRLTQMFNEMSNERIIYVCAPAGYGKTVAVRQWLDGDARIRGIISIDEYDNNPAHLCERLCAVLLACQPNNAALAEIVSHPGFGSAPDEFTMRAISVLSKRKRSVFVIDDLHFLHDERALHILLVFLKRFPENFQFVIISRNDLPSGFSDLWIKGQIVRVTAGQLCFGNGEIMTLYKKRGIAVTPEQAGNIGRFTGGWAIGVNALLLSGNKPPEGNIEYLEDFIRSNVWEKWDETEREFMLCISAARELHLSLCISLTGNAESEKVLNKLIRSGAFISQSVDGAYHYHHLFQNFLKNIMNERGDAYLFPLLEKEGEWYLGCGDFYNAADCFIRCKNHEGIAKCFDLLKSADRNDFIIERMLPIITAPEICAAAEKYPFLFSMMSWCALADGRMDDMISYMNQYYARHNEIAARNPLHAHDIFFMRLLDFRTPLSSLISYVTSLPKISNSQGAKGSLTMNIPLLHRCTRDFSEFACEDTENAIEKIKGIIGWLFGEEVDLLAETLTAGLLYEQGHLERANVHALAANAEIKKHFAPESKFCAMAILINVLDALNQPEKAENIIDRLTALIERERAYYLNRNLKALILRRKLGNGGIQSAREWIAGYGAQVYDNVNLHGIYITFTTCRAYISAGEYDLAIILLRKALEFARLCNRPLDIIEAYVLLSISYWKKKRGFQKEAIVCLEAAVSLAYGCGYTQIFINEGAELSGMLSRLKKSLEQYGGESAVPASFIKMLYLKTMDCQTGGLTSGQPEQAVKYTDKQKTVMKLLCEGKSYREITEIMGIKLPTLRSHISLIYKKLDVTNEMDAIARIKSLKLLED